MSKCGKKVKWKYGIVASAFKALCFCRKPGLTVPFAWDFGKAGPTALFCRKDLQWCRPGLVCPGFLARMGLGFLISALHFKWSFYFLTPCESYAFILFILFVSLLVFVFVFLISHSDLEQTWKRVSKTWGGFLGPGMGWRTVTGSGSWGMVTSGAHHCKFPKI